MSTTARDAARRIPADAPDRALLHNEVHARPTARIRLPALITYVALLNEGVSREEELHHLRGLPGQAALTADDVAAGFLRLRLPGGTLKWERHSEFTRYSLVQPMPAEAVLGAPNPDLGAATLLPPGWLVGLPGRAIAAIELPLLVGDIADAHRTLEQVRVWFDGRSVAASRMGNGGHSMVVTDFMLREDGFERMVVVAPADTTQTRAGRISQRLLEFETYRLMALRGLPVAKALGPLLGQMEASLQTITADLERKAVSDQALLDQLAALAASTERATAEHAYRFSATAAYDALVQQRLAELREQPIAGTQTLGEFMQRRLSPAMATVAATARRLDSLAERIARASALLRTRVDIATEEQNRQLLEKLTRGQALQLRLQSTVEGLSIAAISYYVVSLLLYGGKALKAAGAPLNPEIAAGALIPLVIWAVWRLTRRIHERLRLSDD